MKSITLLLPVVLLVNAATTASSEPSGCQTCATTGQCDAAFRNGPGQYCGSFYDVSLSGNKPCCCPPPSKASCKVSPTQCMCHVAKSSPLPPPPPDIGPSTPTAGDHPLTTHDHPSTMHDHVHPPHYENHYQISPVMPLIVILLLACCCFYYCCQSRDDDDHCHHHHDEKCASSEYTPVATATAVPASYPPQNPAYIVDYGSSHQTGGGGGGAGTAIASGLGGFAVGAIIGDMIGRTSAQANNGTSQGRSGGGGGYQAVGGADDDGGCDVAGDSGGDYGGGGYDIAGDSGDYGGDGYDIEGDS